MICVTEGMRFRVDGTPYECAICLGNFDAKLLATQNKLAALEAVEMDPGPGKDSLDLEIKKLEGQVRKLAKQANNYRIHKKQVERQRVYNTDDVNIWLRVSAKRVRVTADFGADYFIDGTKYVNLILHLKYLDDYGDFATETIYCCCHDPDERSEDAFFTRAVWHHMLRRDGRGAGVLTRFERNLLLRDSGPHFQNNNICYFESSIYAEYHFEFGVSAFAKRHGWNECDGALARFIGAIKEAALDNVVGPPRTAKDAVRVT